MQTNNLSWSNRLIHKCQNFPSLDNTFGLKNTYFLILKMAIGQIGVLQLPASVLQAVAVELTLKQEHAPVHPLNMGELIVLPVDCPTLPSTLQIQLHLPLKCKHLVATVLSVRAILLKFQIHFLSFLFCLRGFFNMFKC